MGERTDKAQQPTETDQTTQEETGSSLSVTRVAIIVVGGFAVVLLIIFAIGLVLAIGDVERAGALMAMFRDYIVIVLAFEGILIVLGLALVALQAARLVNLIQTEVRPILGSAQDSVDIVRVTVEFVSQGLVEPVVQASSFFAGTLAFLREIFAIRRLIKRNGSAKLEGKPEDERAA